ncbi:hypothetical protein MMC26_003337 [Xylographa opegraphella]|nr:hypothetical protein [Xylographa opegraphella]
MDVSLSATSLDQNNATYFRFFDLPTELRMQVYRFILLTMHHFQDQRDSYSVPITCKREFAILQACKQIHDEAIEIWLYENTWIHVEIPETIVRLLSFDYMRLSSQRGISATTPPTLSIRLECPRWKDDKIYTVLDLPESLDIVRWLWLILCQDENCFQDLSLCLRVGGQRPKCAGYLIKAFTYVTGFQHVSIEGNLEEQYMLDLKRRLEVPWTVKDVKGVASVLLEEVKAEFESGRFEAAIEIICSGLTIDTVYTQFALAFIVASFKAQHYEAVCEYYQYLGLVHRLGNFETAWMSCCATVADVEKRLKVLGGQADLTLQSAIESVDDDEDLKVLLHWLNEVIWSDDLLVSHPSYIEYGTLRDGYNA